MIKGIAFAGMKSVTEYFRRHAETSVLFKPELLAAQRINGMIEDIDTLSRSLVIELLQIINDVNKEEHYDGTGWMDYKIRLSQFLKENGFNTESAQKEISLI